MKELKDDPNGQSSEILQQLPMNESSGGNG